MRLLARQTLLQNSATVRSRRNLPSRKSAGRSLILIDARGSGRLGMMGSRCRQHWRQPSVCNRGGRILVNLAPEAQLFGSDSVASLSNTASPRGLPVHGCRSAPPCALPLIRELSAANYAQKRSCESISFGRLNVEGAKA